MPQTKIEKRFGARQRQIWRNELSTAEQLEVIELRFCGGLGCSLKEKLRLHRRLVTEANQSRVK